MLLCVCLSDDDLVLWFDVFVCVCDGVYGDVIECVFSVFKDFN